MLIIVSLASKDDDVDWLEYKEKFHKDKIFEDENKVYKNFKDNQKKIKEHNSNEDRTYDQEENEFSIYTDDEFAAIYCGTRVPEDESDPVVGEIVKAVRRTTKSTTKAATTTPTKGTTTQGTTSTTTQTPVPNWPGPLGSYTRDTVPSFINYTDLYQPIQNQKQCGSCWAFAALSGIGLIIFKNNL